MARRKLNRHLLLKIRSYYDLGHSMTETAEAYGVTTRTVSDVVHRKTYNRVKQVESDFPRGLGPLPTTPPKERLRDRISPRALAQHVFHRQARE